MSEHQIGPDTPITYMLSVELNDITNSLNSQSEIDVAEAIAAVDKKVGAVANALNRLERQSKGLPLE
ncbi:MAG: hypothetical protein ACTIIH_01635 [Brevibacterium sp.]|uniref:hypothetical protein n=1 Tax=Brevibacterium sp. TaxID=1701 RepID=UPI003F8FCEC2